MIKTKNQSEDSYFVIVNDELRTDNEGISEEKAKEAVEEELNDGTDADDIQIVKGQLVNFSSNVKFEDEY